MQTLVSNISFADVTKGSVERLTATKECQNCVFVDADLSDLNLTNVNLHGATFINVKLNNVRLTDANLSDTYFQNTELKKAILNRSNFMDSVFLDSDLSESSLIEANFSNTVFERVKLNKARLRKTNFTSTKLKIVDLSQAKVESWVGNNIWYCHVTEDTGKVDRDCGNFNQQDSRDLQALQQILLNLSYEIGKVDGRWGKRTEKALKQFYVDNSLIAPGKINLISPLVFLKLALKNKLVNVEKDGQANIIFDIQDGLYALGYDIKPDGLIGPNTRSNISSFLAKNSLNYSENDYQNVSASISNTLVEKSVNTGKPVPWLFKSAEISIDADLTANNIYKGLETIQQAADAGFSTITIFIHCDRYLTIDRNIRKGYPLNRTTGCNIPFIRTTDDLLDLSRNATDVYIEKAQEVGLKVVLKPMFLGLADKDSKNIYGYRSGEVPVDLFFKGSGPKFDGYIRIIESLATYAQEKNVDFLQIGTELGNLNRDIIKSDHWIEIIESIRDKFRGELIYAYNLGPEGTGGSDLVQMKEIWEGVDYIGINFFPNNILSGKKYYSSSEVTKNLKRVKVNGVNAIYQLETLSSKFGKKIIFTETSFPSWRGSVNWMFRQSCDFQNNKKKGWLYTEGPLAVKEPSSIAALVLADGWFQTVKDLPFVYGANHSFWYKTWYDNKSFANQDLLQGLTSCAGNIASDNPLTKVIESYYKER